MIIRVSIITINSLQLWEIRLHIQNLVILILSVVLAMTVVSHLITLLKIRELHVTVKKLLTLSELDSKRITAVAERVLALEGSRRLDKIKSWKLPTLGETDRE